MKLINNLLIAIFFILQSFLSYSSYPEFTDFFKKIHLYKNNEEIKNDIIQYLKSGGDVNQQFHFYEIDEAAFGLDPSKFLAKYEEALRLGIDYDQVQIEMSEEETELLRAFLIQQYQWSSGCYTDENNNSTLLSIFVGALNVEIVQFLLDQGATSLSVLSDGTTALYRLFNRARIRQYVDYSLYDALDIMNALFLHIPSNQRENYLEETLMKYVTDYKWAHQSYFRDTDSLDEFLENIHKERENWFGMNEIEKDKCLRITDDFKDLLCSKAEKVCNTYAEAFVDKDENEMDKYFFIMLPESFILHSKVFDFFENIKESLLEEFSEVEDSDDFKELEY